MKQAIEAVIFDIDGTLLDSSAEDDALYRQAVRDILGDVALRGGLADYDDVTDSGILLQILADNGIPPAADTIAGISGRFFELIESHVRDRGPFPERPGARALLSRLEASASHGIAIATGGWRRSAEIKLCAAGFPVGELAISCADDARSRTDIMRIALAGITDRPATVTYYGDGSWDRDACLALGWQFRAVGPALGGLLSFDDEFRS